MAPSSAVLGDLETDRPSGFKKNRLSSFVNVLLSGDANPNRVRAHDPGSRHDRRDRRRPEAILRPRRDEGTAPGRRGGGVPVARLPQIGRAHVRTPDTNAHLVRLLL